MVSGAIGSIIVVFENATDVTNSTENLTNFTENFNVSETATETSSKVFTISSTTSEEVSLTSNAASKEVTLASNAVFETTSASSIDFFEDLAGTINTVGDEIGSTLDVIVTNITDNSLLNDDNNGTINFWQIAQNIVAIIVIVEAAIFVPLNAFNFVNILSYWGQIVFYIVSGLISLFNGNVIEAVTNTVNLVISLFSYESWREKTNKWIEKVVFIYIFFVSSSFSLWFTM